MVSIYQNQTIQDLIVPVVGGTMLVYPMEYVGGSYYHYIDYLTDVTSQNINHALVKYFYPEEGTGISPNGFDTILGTSPIQVTAVGTTATVSLLPISASNIAQNQVVKTYNGTSVDNVVLAEGYGISVVDTLTPTPSTLLTTVITNTQPGLRTATGTLPITLTLDALTWDLAARIDITPQHDGGAVALQTGTPVYQNGFAALDTVYLQNTAFSNIFLSAIETTSGHVLAYIDAFGAIYSHSAMQASVGSFGHINLFTTVDFDGSVYSYGDQLINFSGTGPNYIDAPFSLNDTLTLSKSVVTAPNVGSIVGVQDSSYTIPFITLTSTLNQIIPLITLVSGYTNGTVNNNVLLDIVDSTGISLTKLHGDGIITTKTLEASVVDATTVYADNIFRDTLFVVGPDTIYVTTDGGPGSIIADCHNGPVVVQLPDLASFTKSLEITILKTDTSNNALSFVNGPNSTINGSPLAVNIVTQYAGRTITSSGINWYIMGSVG